MTELLWKRIPLVFGLALWFAFPQTTAFSSPSPHRLTRVELQSNVDTANTTLLFQGQGSFRYTTFSLQQPPRLVIDLRKTEMQAFQGRFPVEAGPLKLVEIQSFPGADASLGRIVVHLRQATRWTVRSLPGSVSVVFAQATPEAALQAFAASMTPSAPKPTALAAAPEAAPSSPSSPSKAGRLVWRSGVQPIAPTHPRRASRLLRITPDAQGLRLQANGSIRAYELLELRNPSRLVLDLYGLQKGLPLASQGCESLPVKAARWGRHPGKVRLVFEPCPSASSLRSQLTVRGSSLRLSFQEASASSADTSGPSLFAASGTPVVEEIGFGETTLRSSVLIQTNHPSPRYSIRTQGKTLSLLLRGARLSDKAQTFLDTSEFQGAVRSFRAFQRPAGVEIVVSLREIVASKLEHQGDLLRWNFQAPSRPHATTQASNFQIQYHPQHVAQARAGAGGMTPDVAATLAQQSPRKRYRGRRISMYFRLVDIHNLLRLFSEISGLNIVTSSDVRGQITLKLRNVPWDQALDVVLRTLKLGQEEEGNIIRIATLEELRKEEEERQKLQEARLLAQPQKIRLIPINYADAQEMMPRVRTVLSPRGDIAIDPRTNVLIIKDYPAFLLRAESLARNLDTQTPQVLIETRIVEANVNFERQFGIQWGGQLLFSPQLGNGTGLLFPNPIGIRGGNVDAAGGAAAGTGESFGAPNYVVNFPASTGRGRGSAVNLLFGSLSGAFNLELRLSAAESAGEVKIISSPKIVTLHKNPATIQQGLQIPFATASAAGTNIQFIAATLSLNVTPQVTADGSVFIRLNISNNAPDFSRGGAAGPAITTKTATTNMLIKDGETMVIGGIYSRRTGSSENRVPFLGTIPILGALFKNYTYNDDRAELLIFVTPRIINRAQTIGGRS